MGTSWSPGHVCQLPPSPVSPIPTLEVQPALCGGAVDFQLALIQFKLTLKISTVTALQETKKAFAGATAPAITADDQGLHLSARDGAVLVHGKQCDLDLCSVQQQLELLQQKTGRH